MQIPITPIRKFLDQNIYDTDKILSVRGISLIQRRNTPIDRRERNDCIKFAFQDQPYKWCGDHIKIEGLPMPTPTRGLRLVNDPRENDLVVYIDAALIEVTHVGIVNSQKTIDSKWTYGSVYSHPVGLVPSTHGDNAFFFRK